MTAAPTAATFRGWLTAQTHRHDSIGDLARDAEVDTCWTTIGWQRFAHHVANNHDASPDVLDALRLARAEYRAWWTGGTA